jgi:hypothetical protein
MPNKLSSFYNDKDTKEVVYNYLIDFLEKEALRQLFEGSPDDNAYQVAEAKKVIEKSFENLEVMFGAKPKPKEQINEAR